MSKTVEEFLRDCQLFQPRGAVYPYTSKLFPTLLRAIAFGMAGGVGKITSLLGPTNPG